MSPRPVPARDLAPLAPPPPRVPLPHSRCPADPPGAALGAVSPRAVTVAVAVAAGPGGGRGAGGAAAGPGRERGAAAGACWVGLGGGGTERAAGCPLPAG